MTSLAKIFSQSSSSSSILNRSEISKKQHFSQQSNVQQNYLRYFREIMNNSPIYQAHSISSSVTMEDIVLKQQQKQKETNILSENAQGQDNIRIRILDSKESTSCDGFHIKLYPINDFECAEEVVKRLAIDEGIGPVYASLFGLRIYKTQIWLSPSQLLKALSNEWPSSSTVRELEFRVRYTPSKIVKMGRDKNALGYYYAQIKNEFITYKVKQPSIHTYSKIVGLSVTDALRHSIENNIVIDSCYLDEIDINKFLPMAINMTVRHYTGSFEKKFKDSLSDICSIHSVSFVKQQFICTFIEDLQPNYGSELVESVKFFDHHLNKWNNISIELQHIMGKSCDVIIISKSGSSFPAFSIYDVCYATVQLCEKTVEFFTSGWPTTKLRFADELTLKSFVSCVDGYHRLSKRWYFNISKQLENPSLNELRLLRSHGPIDISSSLGKLCRNGEVGSYVIRQSCSDHDIFLIDVLLSSCTINLKTIKVEFKDGYYKCLKDDNEVQTDGEHEAIFSKFIKSIQIKSSDCEPVQLRFCVAPSEYDDMPELLLSTQSHDDSTITDELAFDVKSLELPRLIHKSMLITQDNDRVFMIDGSIIQNATFNKHIVTVKWLYPSKYSHEKNLVSSRVSAQETFTSKLTDWVNIKDSTIVKIFGLTDIVEPIGLVLEYSSSGPLDVFLDTNRNLLTLADLLDAVADLSRALLYLREKKIIHNRIRCHNLVVSNEWVSCKELRVKLSDPFISSDAISDSAFLPPEYDSYDSTNKDYTSSIDVWAFGTTLWQIFNYGQKPKSGINANQLSKPADCIDDLWSIMEECWQIDPSRRMEPQRIARDTNLAILTHSSMQAANSKEKSNHSCITSQDHHSLREKVKIGKSKANKMRDIAICSSHDRKTSSDTITAYSLDDSDATLLKGANAKHNSYDLRNEGITSPSNSCPAQTFSYVKRSIEEFLGISRNKVTRVVSTTPPNTSSNDESSVSTRAMTYLFSDDCSDKSSMDNLSQLYHNQDEQWLVDSHRVKLGRVLGNGTCGQVFKAELYDWAGDTEGLVVAAKCINSVLATNHSLCDLRREFDILKTLNHNKIVKVLGLVEEPITLILEYLPYGSLDSYLKLCKNPIRTVPLLQFAIDVVSAMEYLESKKIVHRDLAARNVLVESPSTVKISDFGLAQYMDPDGHYYEMKTLDRGLPLMWCSPETLRDSIFTSKTDVWSYGVLLWEMYSKGDTPKYPNTDKTLLLLLESGIRLRLPHCCPAAIKQVIQNCWKYDTIDRCSFEDLRLELVNIQQQQKSYEQ